MHFRRKIFLYVLGAFLTVNLAGYIASRSTMFAGYLHIEERLARDHMARVEGTLEDEMATLVSLAVDWAAWDDTYEFVVNKNTDYVKSNLVTSTFEELGLDAIIILDAEGQVAYSSGYDSHAAEQVPLSSQFDPHLTSSSPLLNHPTLDTRISGVVSLPQGPLLFSSVPIIQSDMSGPKRGALIMGRFFDHEEIEGLIRQTQLVLSLVPSPVDVVESGAVAIEQNIAYVDEERLEGYLDYKDIYGRDAFRLKVEIPRRISLQGRSTLYTFFVWNLSITFLLSILIYVLIDRWLASRKERLVSEERFRLMFSSSEAGGCVLSDDGVIQQVNPAFVGLLGYSENDLVGSKFFEFVNPVDRIWIVSHFDKMKKMNASFSSRLIHANGKTVWAKGSLGWAGDFAILMIQDISDQKGIEESLRVNLKASEKEKEESNAVLSSAGDGVILVDRYNTVKMCNPAAEQMLEMHSSYMVGRSIHLLIDSEELTELIGQVRKGSQSGNSCDVRIDRVSTEVPGFVRFSAAPVSKPKEDVEDIVLSIHDLTSDYERDQFKNDSIARLAHEIRSPLTVVQGFSEMLLGDGAVDSHERKELIGYIYEKSRALSTLVDDLLDMERIVSGRKLSLEIAPQDINSLLRKIVRQYEKTFDSHIFETKLSEENLTLQVDAMKIEQVIENLLNNAVKYSPVGSKLLVSSKVLDKEFRISIEDNGLGMTADELQLVFDKFYRSGPTADITEGMGLGLTIVKEIVEAHGGRIWLNSVYGEGTRAYVSLPLPSRMEVQGDSHK